VTPAPVSAVIPTYRRGRVLIETLQSLARLPVPPAEIIVVDQTERHDRATEDWLTEQANHGAVRWIRTTPPSIPRAMNLGLLAATQGVVLFLDDDVCPEAALVEAHAEAHDQGRHFIIAGRVLQPWHSQGSPLTGLAGTNPGPVDEFIGCNFSVRREVAISLGGFDERFVQVAYRFEAEFAARVRRVGGTIWFDPRAGIRHLKVEAGGTRSFGDHLRTAAPAHSVGDYYYLVRARPAHWRRRLFSRPWQSIATRHHVSNPWWIVPTLVGETLGLAWALSLWARGPKLIGADRS
jgi:GT2 family glycosyltransferase